MTVTYNILSQLRALNTTAADIDELVALRAFAGSLRDSYESAGLIAPEWVGEAVTKLDQEIADRRRDELQRERKLLDAEEKRLMTKQERREELRTRRQEIDKLLGVPVTVKVATAEEEKE